LGAGTAVRFNFRLNHDGPYTVEIVDGAFLYARTDYKLPDNAGATSFIDIIDGEFRVTDLEMHEERDSSIRIGAAGTLKIRDGWEATYTAPARVNPLFMLDEGLIYAADGLTLSYDEPAAAGDTITITAVPEPATLALLGLGALVLRRKRA